MFVLVLFPDGYVDCGQIVPFLRWYFEVSNMARLTKYRINAVANGVYQKGFTNKKNSRVVFYNQK